MARVNSERLFGFVLPFIILPLLWSCAMPCMSWVWCVMPFTMLLTRCHDPLFGHRRKLFYVRQSLLITTLTLCILSGALYVGGKWHGLLTHLTANQPKKL